MGTITARKRNDGTIGYTAQIRMKRDGKPVHTESQTFDRKGAATAWLRKRESELREPGGLERAKAPDPTLAEAIDRYIAESEREIGRTKAQVLRTIKGFDIAATRCSKIGSPEIVAFVRQIDAKPQTAGNYLSHLGAVFAIARAAWGYPLDPVAMADAFKVTRRLGITAKSEQRERRPSLDELDKILSHFQDRQKRRPAMMDMVAVTAFAIFSTRRLDEITRIAWADLDESGSRILVRDMKNPGEKQGNHVWCDLVPEALRIIQAQPKAAPEIFPAGSSAISANFTRACQFLGIEDLHFHDLRHDGVSRLFEMDWNIPHVAAVSGHRSWSSLKRYTHLRQTGDKYAGWRWLDAVAPQPKEPPE